MRRPSGGVSRQGDCRELKRIILNADIAFRKMIGMSGIVMNNPRKANMKKMIEKIEEFLERNTTEFESLTSEQREEVEKRWLRVYAANVKKQTGIWIYGGFKWHGFSCNYERAADGQGALQKYQENWPAPFFVFDEKVTWAFRCVAAQYPDFSEFGDDIYVVHHNMKWTMVFTHEQPYPGPFFATKEGL